MRLRMNRRFGSLLVILAFLGASALLVWREQTRPREPLVVRVTPATAPSPSRPALPPGPTAATDSAIPVLSLPSDVPPPVTPPVSQVAGERPDRLRGEGAITYLVRVLRNSRDFRVRTQVALSLGRIGSRRAAQALAAALRDEHPSVRSAAAEALGRIDGEVALGALRAASGSERDPAVSRTIDAALARLARAEAPAPKPSTPSSGGTYLVAIARPSAAGHAITSGQLAQLDRVVRSGVAGLAGVVLTGGDSGEGRGAGSAPGFHLDIAVSELEEDGHGTAHAVVSVMVSTHPGRELRGIVKGKATIEDVGEANRAAMIALEGAAKSAVRQLPSAFERAAR